jgi:hypothetical protein
MIAALADAICRLAAAHPRWELAISCVLATALLVIIWTWAELLERAS